MNGLQVAAVVIGAVAAAVIVAARTDAAAGGETIAGALDTMDKALNEVTGFNLLDWQKVAARPENAAYVAIMGAVERKHNMPVGLLVRLAYQESRFRKDVITGYKVSRAGALGIMQIVPRWHPGVNPLNPGEAIEYAGNYLASLYRQFGTWELALQAYNWGQGNLRKYLVQGGALPSETSNYSGQILADLNRAGVIVA